MVLNSHSHRALQADKGGAHVEGRPCVCLHGAQVGVNQRRIQLELIEVDSCCCCGKQLSSVSWSVLHPPPRFQLLALGMLSSLVFAPRRRKLWTVHAKKCMSGTLWDS